MKTLSVKQDLIPLSEFKAHVSQILNDMQTSGRSVIITQNGRAAGVLIHPAEFDRLHERDKFLGSVTEGLENVRDGRTLSDKEVIHRMDKRYGVQKP